MIKFWQSLSDIIWPRKCAVCGKILSAHERFLCVGCLTELPRTGFHKITFNRMEQMLAGKTPIERATAMFFYSKQSPYAAILHDIKYRNMPHMGAHLASIAARELSSCGFFDGIDAIVAVPLHPYKKAHRGYNQSEEIAKGIAATTGLPIATHLRNTRQNDTQTRKNAYERMINAQGLYAAVNANDLRGRHILLVDDVITTGATICACTEALHQAAIDAGNDCKISVFTLALARLD